MLKKVICSSFQGLSACSHHLRTKHTQVTASTSRFVHPQWLPLHASQNQTVKITDHCSTTTALTTEKKYKLPPLSTSLIYKKSILDPVTQPKCYELPTDVSVVLEKVTPSWQTVVPLEAPTAPHVVTDKLARPLLVRIRKKKMKKHKLKKMRKRLIFLRRKLEMAKAKKKEKRLLEYENKWAQRAEEFNAERFVEDSILKTKEDFLFKDPDVVSAWKNKKSLSSGPQQ